ncbi:MAG TPA: VOC family protein [Gemmatimonadota bacterium]|jgi:predicted enzyme related to lactoylglutathione lyase|nr:VOC family protein [Gemmatimonadota bacterium]
MKAKAVDFISYAVTDMDKAEVFWRGLLGLDVEVPRGDPGTRSNGYMELDAGGVAIGLVALPQTQPNGIVALAVDDVGEAVEELRRNGVTIAMETIESPVCWMAVVADPDGNQVLLHRRKNGTAG